MKSFKQMRIDGELIRADAEKIDYFSIHIEPGFNPGGRTEEDDEDDEELYRFIVKHGVLALPQMDVRPRAEGGVWAVDGHRRHKQIGRAIANGEFKPDPKTGKYPVAIRQFTGNDLDRLYHIRKSNKKKTLKPMQLAELCIRARDGFGQTVEQIAEGFLCSVSAVRDALALGGANHDVQQMVVKGEVSKTTAVRTVKAHGEKAGPVLKEAQHAAQMQGKSKVTAKQLDGNTPADLVRAIEADKESGGKFRAEDLAPKYADLVQYLRGTAKS